MGMTANLDLGAIDSWLRDLDEDVASAIRPAAQAGAQVLYQAVKLNVPRSKKGHWFHGTSFKVNGKKYWFNSGTLQRAIYQVYSRDNSSASMATYHISWNHQKAPYGFMVEYGTSKAPPVGFVRRASAQMPRALDVAYRKFLSELKHFK